MDDWRSITAGTHARIDLAAYAGNIRALRSIAVDHAFMAIVKANAYGHGATVCARQAVAEGAEWLGVARIDEALFLRRAGITAPILVLGPPNSAAISQAIESGITLAVGSESSLDGVAAAAGESGNIARVHVKVDTGMHRFGFAPDQVVNVARRLSTMPHVEMDGLFTHFACADEQDLSSTDAQARAFQSAVADLRGLDLLPRWVHQANSAAILNRRFAGTNLVRGGIATYGLSPSDDVRVDERFTPVMSLHSVVGRRFALSPGDGVAYGWSYVAESHEDVATVPVGYADGIPRQLANRGWFVVGDLHAPIRGRVCMDQTVVATDASVCEGDPVIVYGRGSAMSLEYIGAVAGTNNYEIATRVMPRVPRLYVRGDKPVCWELPLLGCEGKCL